ncbi:MAG: hypothetical protein HYV17_12760 [Xanthomonadales bacterium]|nr:hypothetical protein [Xanthomonadales bacterium]
MKRLAALALIAVSSLLGGCVTYDDYAYYDRDGYYDDRYDDSYQGERYYYDRYGNRHYYSRQYGAGYGSAAYRYPVQGYSYGPDYLVYSHYYSALWPTYRYYYDPYWSPGFYYGVTLFPRTYFGLNVGWYSWPYYQAYAPYRHSYADHYYDWWDYGRDRAASRQRYYGDHYLPRYGSARNEAQYLARITGARGAAQTYYGASAQPGSIVDPLQARQLHSRGGTLPFERGTRDWNTQPYGPDGRNYRGFIGQDAPTGPTRDPYGRGVDTRGGASSYPDQNATQTRTSRGYQREMPRSDGYVAPAPNTRSYDRASERSRIRDEREFDTSDSTNVSEDRYYRGGRGTIAPSTPQPQYESRTREIQRNRNVEQHETYQPSAPIERSYSRSIERSEPVFQRAEPSYERPQRSEPAFERSEPSYERPQRSMPSFERSEPRSAPSYDPPSRSDSSSSSSSDDGGNRASRGQLERIVRDDD